MAQQMGSKGQIPPSVKMVLLWMGSKVEKGLTKSQVEWAIIQVELGTNSLVCLDFPLQKF